MATLGARHDEVPSVYLMEPGRAGKSSPSRSQAMGTSGHGRQGNPRRAVHQQPHHLKSISEGTGRASYRGLVQVLEGAHHSK